MRSQALLEDPFWAEILRKDDSSFLFFFYRMYRGEGLFVFNLKIGTEYFLANLQTMMFRWKKTGNKKERQEWEGVKATEKKVNPRNGEEQPRPFLSLTAANNTDELG